MSSFSEAINSSFKDNRVKAMLNILYTANWISSHQNEKK